VMARIHGYPGMVGLISPVGGQIYYPSVAAACIQLPEPIVPDYLEGGRGIEYYYIKLYLKANPIQHTKRTVRQDSLLGHTALSPINVYSMDYRIVRDYWKRRLFAEHYGMSSGRFSSMAPNYSNAPKTQMSLFSDHG